MASASTATTPAQRRSFSHPAFVAGAYTLILRAAYAVYAAVLLPHLYFDPRLIRSNDFTEHLMPVTDRLPYILLGVWERFDTLWYLYIAEHGYFGPVTIGHYPLFPLLIHVVSWLVHPPLAAALAISTTATFFFFWGLQALLELDYPRGTAVRVVYLLGVWPASFMLLAGYPDSTAAAFTVWAIYFARQNRWPLAGALGMFSALSKVVGGVVAVPLLFLGWRKRAWRAWPAILPAAVILGHEVWTRLIGYGSLSDMYSRYWHTTVDFPWNTLAECVRRLFSSPFNLMLALNFAFLVLVCCLALLKGGRPEYRLYAAAMIALFLTKRTDPLLQSTMRYVVVVFPAFLGLATIVKRPFPLMALSAILLAANGVLLLKFFEWSLVV